jgi:hypothetical protein
MSYHIEINEYQRRLIMKALTSTDVNQFSQAPGSGDAFDTEAKEGQQPFGEQSLAQSSSAPNWRLLAEAYAPAPATPPRPALAYRRRLLRDVPSRAGTWGGGRGCLARFGTTHRAASHHREYGT